MPIVFSPHSGQNLTEFEIVDTGEGWICFSIDVGYGAIVSEISFTYPYISLLFG